MTSNQKTEKGKQFLLRNHEKYRLRINYEDNLPHINLYRVTKNSDNSESFSFLHELDYSEIFTQIAEVFSL